MGESLYPSPVAMHLLLGLAVGEGVVVRDGQLRLVVTKGTWSEEQPVPPSALDELEGRGWIDCDAEPPTVTQSGSYWLGRWMKRRSK